MKIGRPSNGVTCVLISLLLFLFGGARDARAWSEHEMILMPVLSSVPGVAGAKPVRVESLADFITAGGADLEKALAEEESWAVKNMKTYKPLPEALKFKASKNPAEARARFLDAIRVNPASRFALYMRLMPGDKNPGNAQFKPAELTLLKDTSSIEGTVYLKLAPGGEVKAIDVLGTATDEPDLGLDIGLFEDNGTAYGKKMGFGAQPFGNPNLEYSSQAPFHMGFYHEAGIVYALAGFLKQTYPEYRIHMFKTLSEFAFKRGHDYWGWRFMGIGLHYLSDISMPYHAVALPGVGTSRMLWINTKAMFGSPKAKNDAIQLVSNRHSALEEYQKAATRAAYAKNDLGGPLFVGMKAAADIPAYKDIMVRESLTKATAEMADKTDETLEACMPKNYVSDPTVELGNVSRLDLVIVETVRKEKGQAAVENMNALIGDLFAPLGVYGKSYINTILAQRGSPR